MKRVRWSPSDVKSLKQSLSKFTATRNVGDVVKATDAAAFIKTEMFPKRSLGAIETALHRYNVWKPTRRKRRDAYRSNHRGALVEAAECPKCGHLFKVNERRKR